MVALNSSLRQFSIVFALALLALAQAVAQEYEYEEDPVESQLIETAHNLPALGELAESSGQIIILAFSTEWCDYCEALEQQVLEPMLINGDFRGRALLRKIVVDDVSVIKDFNGAYTDVAAFARQRNVNLYPTLLFVDAEGNELVNRIVGITVLEFAADTISRAVQQALLQLKS